MILLNDYITKNIFEPYIPKGMVNPKKLLEKACEFSYFLGERSNGKTTNVLGFLIGEFIMSGFIRQFALVRRYGLDITASNCMDIFKVIINNDYISKLTKDTFNGIWYDRKKFYLCKYNEEGRRIITMKEPFCYVFALSEQEHKKGISYPNIFTMFLDEVSSNIGYLTNEFVLFSNLLSTLVRLDDDFKVIMCSNTISRYCPYYREMGLYHIQKQPQGSIEIYNYGEGKSSGNVGVYYCEKLDKKLKKSDKFFSFNNPKLRMITDGKWEIGLYPHLPYKYEQTDILLKYYIIFENEIYQCNIISNKKENVVFTYIHCKTTKIQDKKCIIFCLDDNNPSLFHRKNIFKSMDKIGEKILWFYKYNKVYYQDNFVGDSINNYLKECIKI